jgi:hypothetical protein
MTRAITKTYAFAHEYRKIIASVLAAACLTALVFYGINVYGAISKTIAVQKTENEIVSLSAAVDALNSEYLGLSGAITQITMKSYGMTEGSPSAYISRTASLGRVAVTGHEL